MRSRACQHFEVGKNRGWSLGATISTFSNFGRTLNSEGKFQINRILMFDGSHMPFQVLSQTAKKMPSASAADGHGKIKNTLKYLKQCFLLLCAFKLIANVQVRRQKRMVILH
jgi:hypothetical protein